MTPDSDSRLRKLLVQDLLDQVAYQYRMLTALNQLLIQRRDQMVYQERMLTELRQQLADAKAENERLQRRALAAEAELAAARTRAATLEGAPADATTTFPLRALSFSW